MDCSFNKDMETDWVNNCVDLQYSKEYHNTTVSLFSYNTGCWLSIENGSCLDSLMPLLNRVIQGSHRLLTSGSWLFSVKYPQVSRFSVLPIKFWALSAQIPMGSWILDPLRVLHHHFLVCSMKAFTILILAWNFTKKGLHFRCFLEKFAKVFRTVNLKNIYSFVYYNFIERYTNVDLKILIFVLIHKKVIPWNFRILNPKNTGVIHP